MNIKVLKAEHGDSILINFKGSDEKNHHILIDGGTPRTYNITLKEKVESIISQQEFIDIVVITHVDDDHIGGIIKFVEEIKASKFPYDPVKQYWFNHNEIIKKYFADSSGKIAFPHGDNLENLLRDIGRLDDCKVIVNVEQYEDIYGAKIAILSPNNKVLGRYNKNYEKWVSSKIAGEKTNDYDQQLDKLCDKLHSQKEDSTLTIFNWNSIAFIFEYLGKSILFLGDSHPSVIVESLEELGFSQDNKLVVDYTKLAHHGSVKNTSFKLLSMIDCHQFIVSTNGTHLNLPNKITFAKILCHPKRDRNKQILFLFNYGEEKFKRMFTKEDKEKYNFDCYFENEPYGYRI